MSKKLLCVLNKWFLSRICRIWVYESWKRGSEWLLFYFHTHTFVYECWFPISCWAHLGNGFNTEVMLIPSAPTFCVCCVSKSQFSPHSISASIFVNYLHLSTLSVYLRLWQHLPLKSSHNWPGFSTIRPKSLYPSWPKLKLLTWPTSSPHLLCNCLL